MYITMEANASDAPAVTPEEKPASVTTKKKAASFTPDEKPASVTTEKKKETKPPKNPGRIAAGKKLAEHNRRVRAAKKTSRCCCFSSIRNKGRTC